MGLAERQIVQDTPNAADSRREGSLGLNTKLSTKTARKIPQGIRSEQRRRPMSAKMKLLSFMAILGALTGGVYGISKAIESAANQDTIPAGDTMPEEIVPNDNIIKLTPSSFTPVTPEEEKELWKNTEIVNIESNTFTLGFPIKKNAIDQNTTLTINSYFEPELLRGVKNISELEEAGVNNITQISGLPKDIPIYFNYNQSRFKASVIKLGIAGETQGEGPGSFTPSYTNFRVFLRDVQTGENYSIIISALYATPLIEANPYPTDHSAVFDDGTPITPDSPIFQLTTDLQSWDGKNQILPGQGGQIVFSNIGGVHGNPNPSGVPFLTPVFLKTPAGTIATK